MVRCGASLMIRKYWRMLMSSKPYVTIAIVGLLGQAATMEVLAQAQVSHRKGVTTLTLPSTAAQASADTIDYVNAQALDLPRAPTPSEEEMQADLINTMISPQDLGEPGSSPGGRGNGKQSPIFLGTPSAPASDSLEVEPAEFGTSNHPFSTARADLIPGATNTQFPYRPSGKLFFNIGASTFVCSASLIKRGVIVTAAHCVAQFGARRFHSNWRFVPGFRNGVAPFGAWTAANAFVLTSYFNGTDPCAVRGIVCRNDIATLRLNTQGGALPGTATGFYGFGFNGFGFTGGGLTHVTQIGYPVCLDNGQLMERNDSQGFRSAANVNNTLIGSLMCGGSSGGPWAVNFGIRPVLTGTTNGTAPNPNIVVGVTSWGFVSTAVKQQGASPFLSTNIVPLVNAACVPLAPHCT
ncbi:MAG: trypsin-like serine peptidase [Gammaproteobacteria bacterium]